MRLLPLAGAVFVVAALPAATQEPVKVAPEGSPRAQKPAAFASVITCLCSGGLAPTTA